MARLTDPVKTLKGVGPAKEKLLETLNIFTLGDLICHFPRGYEDRTKMTCVAELNVDEPACFRATVMSAPRTAHIRKGLDLTRLQVADYSGRLTLTFFNSRFAAENLQYGREYIFYGTLTGDFTGYGMTNPLFESPDSQPVATRRIMPIYPLTAGLTNAAMAKLVAQALAVCDPPREILPPEIRQKYHILPADTAYRAIHTPQDAQEAEQAKRRLVFEEFFVFSAGLSLMRAARELKKVPAYETGDMEAFYAALPFALTGAQRRAIDRILEDFRKGTPMNRLVQGDVGSGKTMVAAGAVYCAAKNRVQSALMAPTEILAEQHYGSLSRLFAPMGIRVVLLTGSMTGKQKREAREAIASGQADLAVGTHALISDSTEFQNLGLVITDEQHRFGVKQRKALETKGGSPHILVMTATPIPRTMALSVYGDLDVSAIRGMPPGRHPVKTYAIGSDMLQRVFNFMGREMEAGHQVYVVCPLVEKSEKQDLASAVSVYEELRDRVFPMFPVGLVHGRMKNSEKEAVMQAFHRGEKKLLVATSVIEVGVNVPNATIMFVYGADRFGLSQLHQLRGRVGRGEAQAYCILYSDNQNEITQLRMKLMCEIQDGFLLSEKDLILRGSGEFFGYHQHGMPDLKAADIVKDLPLLEEARKEAQNAMERGMDFRKELAHRFGGAFLEKLGGEVTGD